MNDNQFDNLTREFGKVVSRRDALKLLGAGILSVLFGKYAGGQTRVLAADPVCPADNIVTGTCQDLNDCLSQGVIDDRGIQRGAARNCQDRKGRPIPCCKDEKGRGIPCVGWTNHYYDAPKIGSPNPAEQNGKNICITWDVVSPFSVHSEKSWFSWKPDPVACDCPKCKENNDAWSNFIKAHEQHHEDDTLGAVTRGNDEWNNKHIGGFIKCGKDQSSLENALRGEITRKLNTAFAVILAEADRLGAEWDAEDTPRYKPPPCAECAPRSSPTDCCVPCSGPGILAVSLDPTCGDPCQDVTCSGCTHCENGVCVSDCAGCQACDSLTNTCISTCGECMHCENGACVQTCTACEICDSTTNTCVSHCDECMHCENGLCVRTCTDTEVCCGNQCINPSEFNCCITRDNGSLPCPNGSICCASGECCPPNMQCCGGQCVDFSSAHCSNCFPCSGDQVCCIGTAGQIYGCDDMANCPQ
jgi:hypothetical protein